MVSKFFSLIFQLGLVIDLTNTTRYYPATDLKKEGIKHVKVSVDCNIVPVFCLRPLIEWLNSSSFLLLFWVIYY